MTADTSGTRTSSSPPTKQSLSRIAKNIVSISGVLEYYLLNRQGKLIAKSMQNSTMSDFIAYCIVSGKQMREAFGERGLHNIRIRMEGGKLLLIIPIGRLTYGLLLDKDADLSVVAQQLRKAFRA